MTLELPVSTSGKGAEDVMRHSGEMAREILLAGFGQTVLSSVKGRGNIVTETDLAAERAVTEMLQREFPGHGVLGEEGGQLAETGAWLWVIDPVDGTKNFSQGIAHFAYSIALYYGDEPQLGLILQPLLNDWYVAKRGAGATWNGVPMQASTSPSVYESVVGMDLGYEDEQAALQLDVARAIWPHVQSLRISGSAALGFAYAASGQFDLYVHADLKPWDLAAGLLLVEEAGGVATDRDGSPAGLWKPGIIAGGAAAHRDFLERYGALPWDIGRG